MNTLNPSKDGNGAGQYLNPPRPTLPLMGWGSILINVFGTGLGIFFKTRDGFGYCPTPPHPVYKYMNI